MTQITLTLPATATPHVVEALHHVLECVEQGFTGDLNVSFHEGNPTAWKRTAHGRYHGKGLTPTP